MKNAVDRKNILWQHLQASGMEGKMAVRKGLGKGLDSLIVSKNEGSPEKEKKENVARQLGPRRHAAGDDRRSGRGVQRRAGCAGTAATHL